MLLENFSLTAPHPSFTTGSTINGTAWITARIPIRNPTHRCSTFSFSCPIPVTMLTRFTFIPSASTNGTMATATIPALPAIGGGPSSGERA